MEVSGKRSDVTEIGAAEDLKTICEVCAVDHVTTKANGICRECEQSMCDTCFRHHLKVKSCRQHVLVDINQSLSPVQASAGNVEKCKHHANEKIKYFCRKHEAVGCGDCMIPVHGPCKPENIKELSKQFHRNKDFKSLMKKIQDLTDANDNNDKRIQLNKKANTNMLQEALKEIKTFRTEINKYLDKAETRITKEAKDVERNNNSLLAKLEQDCNILSSKITEVRQKLDKELYQDNALFIQTVNCKPNVLDIELEVSRIQRENDIRIFEFIPDKQLQCIISATTKLGCITKPVQTSTTEPDTTTETKTESKEEAADGKTLIDKAEKGTICPELIPAARVVVGTRVRPAGNCVAWNYGHLGQPGTVIAVNSDGTINVKWDATGCKEAGCRMRVDVEPM